MDLGTFLGAFLGFLGGFFVERLASWWHQRVRRRAYRGLIANELAYNLSYGARMEAVTRATIDSGLTVLETTIARPQANVLRSVLSTGDVLTSLTVKEQVNIAELAARTERLLRHYEWWLASVRKRTASDDDSRRLLSAIDDVRTSEMMLLAQVLGLSSEGSLPQPKLRELKQALAPTWRGWLFRRKLDALYSTRIPARAALSEDQRSIPVVVWERGDNDYDGEVIELSGILGD